MTDYSLLRRLKWILVLSLSLSGGICPPGEAAPPIHAKVAALPAFSKDRIQEIAELWVEIAASFPPDTGTDSPLEKLATQLLKEEVGDEQADLLECDKTSSVSTEKVMEDFCEKLAKWLNEERGPANKTVAALLETNFAQAYQEEQKALDESVRAVLKADAEHRRNIKLFYSPKLFWIKRRLEPTRFFLADGIETLLNERKKVVDAAAVRAVFESAALRAKMMQLRIGKVTAISEKPALSDFFSSVKLAPLAREYVALLMPLKLDAERKLDTASVQSPPLEAFPKVLALEARLREASQTVDDLYRQVCTLYPEIAKLGQMVVEAAQEYSAKNLVVELAHATPGVWLRARLALDSEPGEPINYRAEFFLVHGSGIQVCMVAKKKPEGSAPEEALQTGQAEAEEELPFGLKISGALLENGHLIPKQDGRWHVTVDGEQMKAALTRLGLPEWLLRDVHASYSEHGMLELRIAGREPSLAQFGVESLALPPVTINLDIYSGKVSIQSQVVDALRKVEERTLATLWTRLWGRLQQVSPAGWQFVDASPMVDMSSWPRTIRLEHNGNTLIQAEVGLALTGGAPQFEVTRFETREALRSYFREEVLARLQDSLAWQKDLSEFVTLTVNGLERDAGGIFFSGSVAVSFNTLRLDVPLPPALKFRFRPFQKEHRLEISTDGWREWYAQQRQMLQQVLAEKAQGMIAESIGELGGQVWTFGPGLKITALEPVSYLPEKHAYRLDTEWELGSDSGARFKVQGVHLLGGYDAAQHKWMEPKLDFHEARIADPQALEAAVRNLLHLPSTLGNDRVRITGLRLDRGGIAFALHLGLPELNLEVDTGEIIVSPNGLHVDLRLALREALQKALTAQLAKSDVKIAGLGPVRSLELDKDRTHFDPDVVVGVLAKLHFMDRDFDVPVRVFPSFAVDRAGLELALKNEVGRWVQGAFQVHLKGFDIEAGEPPFILDPPRVLVNVKFDVPFLSLKMDGLKIGQNGVELPDRLALGSEALGRVIEGMVRTSTESIVVLANTRAVFFPKEAGRFEILGDLTAGDTLVGNIAKITATLGTDLRRLSDLNASLTGNLVLLNKLSLLRLDGSLSLGKKLLQASAKADGFFAKILDPSLESTLDFGEGLFREHVGLRVLRMSLGDVDFHVKVKHGFDVGGQAQFNLLVGNLAAAVDANADRGLRWHASGSVDINIGAPIASANLDVTQSRAKMKLKALGFPLTVSVPGPMDISPGLLWDLIQNLFHVDLETLKALLSGNITIGPGHGSGDGGSTSSSDSGDGDDGKNKGQVGGQPVGPSTEAQNNEKPPGDKPQPDAPAPNTTTPPSGGQHGPQETGVAVWESAGTAAFPGIATAGWLQEGNEKGAPVHTWRSEGQGPSKRVWRIAIINDHAFVCPYYFTAEDARKDIAAPLPLAAARLLPKPETLPSLLAHDMIDELLNFVLPQTSAAGGHFPSSEGNIAMDNASSATAVADAVAKGKLEVFRFSYPHLESDEQERDEPETLTDESAHSTAVLKLPDRQIFLVRFRAKGSSGVYRFVIRADDGLLKEGILPSREEDATQPEAACLAGQYARLSQRGECKLLYSASGEVYFYAQSQIAVLQRQVGGHLTEHALSAPEPLPAPHALSADEWAPIAQIVANERKAKTLLPEQKLFVDHASPHRLLVLQLPSQGKDWAFRYFAAEMRPERVSELFVNATGRPLGAAYQALGKAIEEWVQAGNLQTDGASALLMVGCPTGVETGNAVATFAGCTDVGTHWAIYFQVRTVNGQRQFAWVDLRVPDPGQFKIDEMRAKLAASAQTRTALETHREIGRMLTAFQFHRADIEPLLQVQRAVDLPPRPWGEPLVVEGARIQDRYLEWDKERHAIPDEAHRLKIGTLEGQSQLAELLFAPVQTWSAYLNGSPRGLVFGSSAGSIPSPSANNHP